MPTSNRRPGWLPLLALLWACGGGGPQGPAAPSSQLSLPTCGPPPPPAALSDVLPCPSSNEIAEINQEIPIRLPAEVLSGRVFCGNGTDAPRLTAIQTSIYQALVFLKRLRFTRPLPWTHDAVYDWFRRVVRELVVEVSATDISHNAGGAVFIVFRTAEIQRASNSLADVPFAGLVHEARHSDGGGHNCGTGDRRVDDLGAFGVQYYLLVWIAEYSAESDSVRAWARRQAWTLLTSGVFCAECRPQSGSLAGAITASIDPNPVRPTKIEQSATQLALSFSSTEAETAGVEVTITRMEWDVVRVTTGESLAIPPRINDVPTVLRPYGSTTQTFGIAGLPLIFRAPPPGEDVVIRLRVQATDALGNSLSTETSAPVR